MGPSAVHHLPQLLRVLQHGTGEQVIIVEGLPVMIRHEHGGSQTVQQGFLPDVGIGIVDEHTGIDVAVGIDVEVSAAPGNAPAHIFAVVLKVHGKQGLGGADFPDAVVHRFPLLRIGHQRRDSIIAHGI